MTIFAFTQLFVFALQVTLVGHEKVRISEIKITNNKTLHSNLHSFDNVTRSITMGL